MSCWRVLELAEASSNHVPQLLIKPVFGADSYTVHLTCLSNIWSEELDLGGIVDRATEEQSPIEVSKHDTAQLAILLDNIEKSLRPSDDAICSVVRSGDDGLTLHTTITLPKPLDSLTWKFNLKKRASTALKNELILPLLISSHIQHERISALVSAITGKDKAITRLVDQYESSNLDLAAAFPTISGLKTGRRAIKREQAAKLVPALQPFREDAFKQETSQLADPNVSTLGLFQQALSECTPEVPSRLQSDDAELEWWHVISDQFSHSKRGTKPKAKIKSKVESVRPSITSDGEETEDEFEIHANFKTRALSPKIPKTHKLEPVSHKRPVESDDESTEDEEDLDALPQGPSQRSSQNVRKPSPSEKATTPAKPRASIPDEPPAEKPKSKSFRIGGKAKPAARESPSAAEEPDAALGIRDQPVQEQPPSQTNVELEATPKKSKRTFKIGGKGKGCAGDGSQVPETAQSMTDRTRAIQSPSAQPPSSPPERRPVKEESPAVVEDREETAEEKAERRRAELKRKTEEAAKKQAQSKKKRRF